MTDSKTGREIKFRAWYESGNKGVQMRKVKELRMNDRYGITAHLDGGGTIRELNQHLIMQFTGLHDKNGKEIYEDDIVESDESDVDGRAYHVMFEDGCFYASHEDQSYFLHELEWEIVANIHENPRYLQGIIE